MGTERLDAELKARVPSGTKTELEAIASARHLDTADIVREALRDYLAKQKPEAEEENKQEVTA